MRRTTRASLLDTPLMPLMPTSTAANTRVLRSHTAAQATIAPSKVTKPKPKARRKRADPWTSKRKPNPNPRPRPPPRTHFTCRICIEEQLKDQFPTWIPPKRRRWGTAADVPYPCVAHLARNPNRRSIDPVCNTCIGHAMSACLDQLGARRVGIGCIEPGCETEWDFHLIMKYFPAPALEKYNLEMFEVWKHEGTPKLLTCLAPDCNAIGLPDNTAPGYPQVSCNTCTFRSCAQCLVPWHKDFTCTEHAAQHITEQMTNSEKDTLKLMQDRDGKRCPNCFLVIEKDGGCNSMFCSGCQKFFNWASAASAVPGAKKAEQINATDWMNVGPVVCEMDALHNEESALVGAAA